MSLPAARNVPLVARKLYSSQHRGEFAPYSIKTLPNFKEMCCVESLARLHILTLCNLLYMKLHT